MGYLATLGGISSNVDTQKLILDMQKDWRFAKHKGTPNSYNYFYNNLKTLYS